MSDRRDDRLDPRAWLLWGVAASLPASIGRNPFVLAATLLAVLGVRAAWGASGVVGWGGIARLAALAGAVGVLFNLLTVHVGDRVLARLPEAIPVVGGPLTLNAVVYGLLGGGAVLSLVLVGTTLGAVLDGPALLRLLPARLTAVAVAGSVAWAFVPQTAVAFRQIREAQAARGHRLRGARDLVPLLVPLLTGGLERALILAEALESRAFGAPLTAAAPATARAALAALGLAGGAVGAYLLAAGWPLPALATLAAAAAALVVAVREPERGALRRTRYRPPRWDRSARIVAGSAALALAAQVAVLALNPAAFAYEPYPRLVAPTVDLTLLAALGLLLVPAFAVPPTDQPTHGDGLGGVGGDEGRHPGLPLPTTAATAPPSPDVRERGVGGVRAAP